MIKSTNKLDNDLFLLMVEIRQRLKSIAGVQRQGP